MTFPSSVNLLSYVYKSYLNDNIYSNFFPRTGSAPNSPELARKSPALSNHSSNDENSLNIETKIRRKLARASTLRQSPGSNSSGSPNQRPSAVNIKGTEMSLCRDCKAMILDIIKSSRVSTGATALLNVLGGGMNSRASSGTGSPANTLSPASPATNSPGGGNFTRGGIGRFSLDSSRMPQRNFRLDLKPVYKAT